MEIIKQSHLFNESIIKFEINDNYCTIDSACKSRLDLFNLPSSANYSKILYLDIDILITNDIISDVFDICKEDVLYAVEEGVITHELWGGEILFGDEINNYENKTAFSSGILLFNNSEKIRTLFNIIKQDMETRTHHFHDQPFIVYNAFKYNLYDNQSLKSYTELRYTATIDCNKIVHFAGGPGRVSKVDEMRVFLNMLKNKRVEDNINKAKKYIDEYLMPIISSCAEPLEGNIFMFHHTFNYTDQFIDKAKNITRLVANSNIKNVMEIGFNSGFSSLLMLLSNPNIQLDCFDLGEHSYTMPCFIKLKETFGDRINLVIGDSTKTLESVNSQYDFIHIDGGHSNEVAECDIENSYRLSKHGTILIMDDYDFPNLHKLWDRKIAEYGLLPLNIHTYPCPYHDIKFVTKK